MEARSVCVVLALQMVIWASATSSSRPLVPNHDLHAHHLPPGSGSGQRSDSEKEHLRPLPPPPFTSCNNFGGVGEKEKKLGSSPPSCAHKCNGCYPCEAIQVPATSNGHGGRTSVGLQYTNYEPEGWKCKCGPALFSP